MIQRDIVVIGGGAAGFFSAINLAQWRPDLKICILEKSGKVLSKVRISGGGRCNVTHAEYDPQELVKNYPRGKQELLGPFHKFMTADTVSWFEDRGVPLKTEEDGRIFPESNTSESIAGLFEEEASNLNIDVFLKQGVQNIIRKSSGWEIHTQDQIFFASKVIVATGGSPKVWRLLEDLGHRIISGVPSLFTFDVQDERIQDLSGVSMSVTCSLPELKLQVTGPLLITHWGLSGPCILKLSAFGARELSSKNSFGIRVNWLPQLQEEHVIEGLKKIKGSIPRQGLYKSGQFGLPKRLWRNLLKAADIGRDDTWAEVSKEQLSQLVNQLVYSEFLVSGKSTFKEEFVTAGGVDLKEIDFRTFESKLHADLFLAGEVLNIDALTGGFNFQNAWTGAYLIARRIADS